MILAEELLKNTVDELMNEKYWAYQKDFKFSMIIDSILYSWSQWTWLLFLHIIGSLKNGQKSLHESNKTVFHLRPQSFETMVSVLFDRGEGGAGNYKYKCKKFINAKTGRKNQIWLRTCSFSFIYNYHTQSRVSHSLFPLRRGTLSGMWGVPCDL